MSATAAPGLELEATDSFTALRVDVHNHLTTPGVYVAADDAQAAARQVNDEYAAIRRGHPVRFRCLAMVPLGSGGDLEELDRAIGEPGLDGVIMPTNLAGRPLDDPGRVIPSLDAAGFSPERAEANRVAEPGQGPGPGPPRAPLLVGLQQQLRQMHDLDL